jgi:FAD/FMN-containing dehydrogenase
VWCYTGPHVRADEILEPVRTFGSPLLDAAADAVHRAAKRLRRPLPGRLQDRVRDSYRGNHDRLARIKGRYDPDNTFRINQNIQPAR